MCSPLPSNRVPERNTAVPIVAVAMAPPACKPAADCSRLSHSSMLKISLLLLAASMAAADRPASVAASAIPQTAAIKLGGAFNESAWDNVPAISDFHQREPKDGGDPTFATEVKVAYD